MSFQEFKLVSRVLVFSAAFAALTSIGASAALAQSPSAKLKSPGQIAAVSKLIAERNEICRQQAKAQGLHLLKRHRFMRECKAAH
jgi:hypothetical protein